MVLTPALPTKVLMLCLAVFGNQDWSVNAAQVRWRAGYDGGQV
jgi:hypothetical protein